MGVLPITALVTACVALAAGVPTNQQRVVGGGETSIQAYPFSAALLYTRDFINYSQRCGGTIINNRAIMTSAKFLLGDAPIRWRIRVGSTFANFGGIVSNSNQIIIHPNFNVQTLDYDIAIIRSATIFVVGPTIRPAAIAGVNYNVPDNAIVYAIGWGATAYQGEHSETLRDVQMFVVNQETCKDRYAEIESTLTDTMLCTGWLDVGGRSQCAGDEGSPIIHNNVIVGVHSWGQRCGLPRYPGVSARISRFTNWLTSNA